ncbi:MAG TPA: type II toxin-antitoxin system HicA family toxin [Dehalococcoidia bacterium]|nr:type II toxin-antitoxin system HicA family toxin [Dehalococcoidia bacterium]
MPKLPILRPRQVITALKRDGWYEVKGRGGHRQLKHPTKPGRVTLPVHGDRPLRRDIIASILHQAGLTADELQKLL